MDNMPRFPTLEPKLVDSAWFNVDQPNDNEKHIAIAEEKYQNWLHSISQRNAELVPIGKTQYVTIEEDDDDEDDEDDNDDDDESESQDDVEEDELDIDSQERSSPQPLNM